MAPKASAPIEPSVRADGHTSCARALDAAIEAAARALAGRETPGDGLLLLCSMQEALPRLALQDPTLEPVDKIVWANLWLWAKEHGAGAAFPSYETLMRRANVRSRATAARARHPAAHALGDAMPARARARWAVPRQCLCAA